MVEEDLLIQISNKIKEVRQEKGITLQELANKAQVSKGLISQIENNRTVPSLWVLMSIVRSLKLDLNEFFSSIQPTKKADKVSVQKAKDYQAFEKETAKGFMYKRIMTRNIHAGPLDIVLLELKKGAKRSKLVRTEAYEYKYIIKGSIEYLIDGKKYLLNQGDSLFFDGRLPHRPSNIGNSDSLALVVYFFIEEK